ncbi:MAG TPA: chemotaxis protein CheC [Solirubrobacteraceae bacterium]|nr:chemotaxis protein CheC [Solirubrobacteraceae bacterium]
MNPSLSETQLDALRELANIASGTAATALSQMLAREVEINVPRALALPPADAVDECGDPEQHVAGVVVPIQGDIDGIVLLLIPYEQAEHLCGLLGVEAHTEVGDSALREIGNILATSYLNGLGAMTGMELEPSPPLLHTDMLAAIVSSLLVGAAGTHDLALVLDSELDVSGDPCSISFLLLPTSGQIVDLLAPLGLAEPSS